MNITLSKLAKIRAATNWGRTEVDLIPLLIDSPIGFTEKYPFSGDCIVGDAAKFGKSTEVDWLLRHGNITDANVLSRMLCNCIQDSRFDVIDILLDWIQDLPARDDILRETLSQAAYSNSIKYCEQLLQRGYRDILFGLDSAGALFTAAQYGHWETVRMLAERGAPIGPFSAILLGDDKCLSAWIEHDPSVIHWICPLDFRPGGVTPLGLAIWGSRLSCIEVLLDHGADITFLTNLHDDAYTLAYLAEFGLGPRYSELASYVNNMLGAQKYPVGASPHEQPWASPVYALLRMHHAEPLCSVDWLQTNPEDFGPLKDFPWRESSLIAALFCAALHRRTAAFDCIASMLNPDKVDWEHLLMIALNSQDRDLVSRIFAHNPNLPVSTDCIFAAISGSDVELKRIIFSRGRNALSLFDYEGKSAMHATVHGGSPETLALLLEYGVDPNIRMSDRWGFTPLHMLGMTKRWDADHEGKMLETLLHAGATLDAQDGVFGLTPAEWYEYAVYPDCGENPFRGNGD